MKKILAIDDNKDNLITIKAVIENNLKNCKILTALSGKEGVKIAQKEQPDTILLDIVMPGMDGYEVCTQLKENNLTKHIPVIMVTAIKIDTASKVKGLNLGADAFISKPIDSIELSAKLNVMLRIKEAEDKLRKDKDRLDILVHEKTKEIQYQATVLENISDPIISTDMDNTIVSWNKAAEKLYGYKEKEVVGKLYSKILKPEYPYRSREEILNELHTSGITRGEIVHYKKDGTRLIITGSVSFMKDGDGAKIGTVSVNHDITLRKEALDISLKLSTAIYNSNEVIFLTDKEGIITFVNPEFIRLYGYTAEEVVGKLTPRILKSDTINREGYEQFWEVLCSKQNVSAVAYINKCKNGKLIDVEGSANPILDEDNEIIGFLGIQRDITERVKSEEKIKEQACFMAQNPAPVFSTNCQGIINAVNPVSENISKHFKIGNNVFSIFKYIEKSTLENITENKQIQMEEAIGGNTYLFTIKKDATTKQIYFFGSNVTQLKETRKDLIVALEKATESDRLKSAFLATMSHELRTPLNAIIGFSDLIDQEMSFNDVLSYNKSINSSGNQLLRIIEDLFDITLIEVGEVNVIKENLELIPFLNNVHEIIQIEQRTTRKQHIDLKLNIPLNNESLKIKSDLSKLKQILINLLKNALKFTEEGFINYGYTLEKNGKTSTIKFYIKDTGIGIPKDKQELIFENFRQIDDSYTRIYGGAGVGLSIARKLTHLLGGRIWVESVFGKGSTFYFTIPYEENNVKYQTEKSVKDPHAKKDKNTKDKTVLIVEDDIESSEFLKVIIGEHIGMKTLFAKNGKDAITTCEENPNIDLILMDINMPIMNGYEATRVIKNLRPNLPIIAQTAYAIFGDREKALEAGCDDYISKPINREELMEKINSALISNASLKD